MQDKTKKTKKQTKVCDLKPKKDAKGGIIAVMGPRPTGGGKSGNRSGDIIAI
jgi:hypothetical protein